MRTIDYDEAYDLVCAIVQGQEDYVDPFANEADAECEYSPTDSYRGCIVGQMLGKLGVEPWVLRSMDKDGTQISTLADLLRKKAKIDLTPKALRVWEMAQHMQDSKCPWWTAMTAAQQVRNELWVADQRNGGETGNGTA